METWMLMEYCERGSLEYIIKTGRCKLPNGHPNLPMIIACLLDIASGDVDFCDICRTRWGNEVCF